MQCVLKCIGVRMSVYREDNKMKGNDSDHGSMNELKWKKKATIKGKKRKGHEKE